MGACVGEKEDNGDAAPLGCTCGNKHEKEMSESLEAKGHVCRGRKFTKAAIERWHAHHAHGSAEIGRKRIGEERNFLRVRLDRTGRATRALSLSPVHEQQVKETKGSNEAAVATGQSEAEATSCQARRSGGRRVINHGRTRELTCYGRRVLQLGLGSTSQWPDESRAMDRAHLRTGVRGHTGEGISVRLKTIPDRCIRRKDAFA